MFHYFEFAAKIFQYLDKSWQYLGEENLNANPDMGYLSARLTATEATNLRDRLQREYLEEYDALKGIGFVVGDETVWTSISNGPIRIRVDFKVAEQ